MGNYASVNDFVVSGETCVGRSDNCLHWFCSRANDTGSAIIYDEGSVGVCFSAASGMKPKVGLRRGEKETSTNFYSYCLNIDFLFATGEQGNFYSL